MKQNYIHIQLLLLIIGLLLQETVLAQSLSPQPTVQSSAIIVSNIGNNSANINWTNGNGSRRMVIICEKLAINPYYLPQDGRGYAGNSIFKSGSNLGAGMYVVYNGTESNVTVTGLFNGTTYNITVIEANGTNSTSNYLTSTYSTNQFLTTGPIEPTINASNINFTNITNNTVDINWTNGNGERRIVIAKEKSTINPYYLPQDGGSYTANSNFKSGQNLGDRMYVLYDGTGSNFTVSNLFNGTTYYLVIIEYNGTGTQSNYKLDTYPLPNVMTTGPTEPTLRTSNFSFTNRTESSMQVNFTRGNGQNRLVMVREGAPTDTYFSPQDGVSYTANSTFREGQYLGWVDEGGDKRQYIVYNGSGNSFTINGLQPGLQYHVAVFEYNGSGSTSNYNVDIYPQNPNPFGTTLSLEPTVNASNLIITSITNNSMNFSWTNGNGSRRIVIASTNPIPSSYLTRDGRDYLANSTFGSGSSMGNNTFVVYKSSGSSFTLSGLNSGTQYYIAVIEFNGTGNSNNYLTSGYLTGNEFTSGIRTPTMNSSNLIFSNITNNSMDVGWTSGNGSRRIVIACPDLEINPYYLPQDGQEYSMGTNLGAGMRVIYNGVGSTLNASGLSSGTNYYLAVIEYNGTGNETRYLRNNYLTGSQFTTGAQRPTINANNLTFTNVLNTSMDISWTNGNGTRRMVIACEELAINDYYLSSDGIEYAANSIFRSGSHLGAQMYVVYNGNGNSFTTTGLKPGTNYYFAVIEFNGTGGETKYLRSNILKGSQITTGATRPTVNATDLIISNVTNNGVQLDWMNGNGSERVVIMSTNPFNNGSLPQDGRGCANNPNFGSGSYLNFNTYSVFRGTGNSVNVTGLSSGTTYYIAVLEFNGLGTEIKYLKIEFLNSSFVTTGPSRPTINATNLLISNITNNSVQLNWINGNGTERVVLASTNPFNSGSLPPDGKGCLNNSVFGNGTALNFNTYSVFRGIGNSVNVTGLSPGVLYYVAVLEFGGTGIDIKYLTTNYLQGSLTTTSTSNLRLASSSESEDYQEIAITAQENEIPLSNFLNILQLYPNPTSDKVTLSLELENNSVSHVTIHSLQGSLVFVNKYHGSFKENIEVKGLSKGVYVIKVKNETNLNLTKRLIIN